MQVYIHYSPTPDQQTDAALIAGADVRTWLKELSRWNLQPDDMEWYILPGSRQSPAAAGLFVIFKNPEQIRHIELLDPYKEIAPRLFIPLDAKLSPSVKNDEWRGLMIWHRQIFHPALGLIGFENADRVDAGALLQLSPSADTDWSFASPGLIPQTSLTGIVVIQPSVEDLMGEMKQHIGENPLDDIPQADDEPNLFMKIINGILMAVFVVFSFISMLLFKILSAIFPKSKNRPVRYSPPSGLYAKLMRWFNKNLGNLQQRRDKEMERLLKMFDKDQEEALKYAIPLNSPYMNRGEKEGLSSRLAKRLANFNAGGLTGGGFAEIWNIDKYRQTLHQKYLASAQKEIERKNFSRAAYIYAHLLGDYHGAANCLEQGGFYREAAALYKDHLKNIKSAATCLERGRLYSEAIGLYEQLGDHEKAGDLYMHLNNSTQAKSSYEKHVDAKLNTNDFLDAARVLSRKLDDDKKAKKVLLTGWHSAYQPEPCLKRYFDLVSNEGNAAREARRIYTEETPPDKRKTFLDVLGYVKSKAEDEEERLFIQDLAFEVVTEEAEAGDLSLLENLPGFIPGDKLLKGDSGRYRADNQSQRPRIGKPFFLDKTVVWSSAIRHGDQVLVLGERNDFLQLARINEQGVVDYFSWSNVIPRYCYFEFIHDQLLNDVILLRSSSKVGMEKKVLPQTKNFRQSLSIYTPTWMQHDEVARFAITGEDELIRMNFNGPGPQLDFYNLNGLLKKSVPIEGGSVSNLPMDLLFLNRYVYTFFQNVFYEIAIDGTAKEIQFDTHIRLFGGVATTQGAILIISTNKGCYIMEATMAGLQLNREEIFFKDLIPAQIVALSKMHFAFVEGRKVLVVIAANSTLGIIKEFKFDTKIISVVPANGAPYRFLAVEENSRVTVNSYE